MTKEEFIALTGENPEDVLGPDFENIMEEYLEDSEHFHNGHQRGSCFDCKMD